MILGFTVSAQTTITDILDQKIDIIRSNTTNLLVQENTSTRTRFFMFGTKFRV